MQMSVPISGLPGMASIVSSDGLLDQDWPAAVFDIYSGWRAVGGIR